MFPLITPGNVYDSQVSINLIKHPKRAFSPINHVIAIAGYGNQNFDALKTYLDIPYTALHGVKEMFRKKTLSMMIILIVTHAPKITLYPF